MRTARWVLLGGLALAPFGAAWALEGLGLTPRAADLPWARWQGRISMGTSTPLWRAGLDGFETPGLKAGGLSLMGDYYFTRSFAGPNVAGGFRATSGVIIGPRSQWWASQPGPGAGAGLSIERRVFGASGALPGLALAEVPATRPYVGIGYTGLTAAGGWSFSADLGLLGSTGADAVRLGRTAGASQAFDDLVHEMRLAPVLQLGVSYSF